MAERVVKKNPLIEGLLDDNEELFKSLVVLQNEINVSHNTKVIAVTSVDNEKVSAAFARALALAYAKNNSSACVIDANLYNPTLFELLGDEIDQEAKQETEVKEKELNDKVHLISLTKVIYPSEVYKEKFVHDLIKKNEAKYGHIILVLPSVRNHKEIVLLKDVIGSVLVLARRNVSVKKDVFNVLSFLANEKLPVAKTIVLK